MISTVGLRNIPGRVGPALRRALRSRWSLFAGVLALGIFARYADLATHFTHTDDVSAALTVMNKPWLAFWQIVLLIPLSWTYAPLQYVVTPLLLNSSQSYREILFWGRFPSFLASVGALALLIPFYRKWKDASYFPSLLASLAILALSWEHVIYAKQISPYSLGVLAAIALAWLLAYGIDNTDTSMKSLSLHGFMLALFSHGQYQAMFFAPGYLATLLVAHWKGTANKLGLAAKIAASGAIFGALMVPIYRFFLWRYAGRGINWNAGPNNEFVLTLAPDASLFEKLWQAVGFFIRNTVIMLQANLAVVPESHFLYPVIGWALTVLFVLGIVSFALTAERRKRLLGLYFLATALVWVYLISRRQLTLSPTRHSLIIMPYIAIVISEGLVWVLERAREALRGAAVFSLLLAVAFVTCFGQVVSSRRDPFDEEEIWQVLTSRGVETVIGYDYTAHLGAMFQKKGKPPWNYFYMENWQVLDHEPRFGKIALVSHRGPLTPQVFEQMRQFIFKGLPGVPVIVPPYSEYKTIYAKEIASDVEIDFSSRTHNGTNGLYLYVLERPA